MNNTVKSEKYRKLSTTALVTGILAVSLPGLCFIFCTWRNNRAPLIVDFLFKLILV